MLTKVYLHATKDKMWNIGAELGLRGEALDRFMYALYEVEIEIDVKPDGTYTITGFKE